MPVLFRDIYEHQRLVDTRVVNHDIQAAKGINGYFYDGLYVSVVGDIEFDWVLGVDNTKYSLYHPLMDVC
ncbi:hypothetical protein [Vreelandella zhaodongensis]|uniref:hypothetical protein n=1 Tax=Vreelandella zhaodongensis TaxID=1176240 RepID=UPI003EB8F2B4